MKQQGRGHACDLSHNYININERAKKYEDF